MKPIHISLVQVDNGTFRVSSFRNTAQLRIGMEISAKQLAKWDALEGVTYAVTGLAPVEQGEITLA